MTEFMRQRHQRLFESGSVFVTYFINKMVDQNAANDGQVGQEGHLDEVSKESARERRDKLFEWGFDEDSPALIEALPAVGKSYGVVRWAAETGNPVTVFTERHELYDQYEEWATDDFELSTWQLPVFHDECPTVEEKEFSDYRGVSIGPIRKERNEELRKTVLGKYAQGVSGEKLHKRASTYFDRKLPCQDTGPCPYMEALERDTDDVDVLIGNFRQAFADRYQENRYIVFDEFPNDSFIEKFSSKVASKTVGRFLSNSSDLPFENWDGVVRYNHNTQTSPAVEDWLTSRTYDIDTTPLYRGNSSQVDSRGPLLTEVGFRLGRLDNGWQRADLGNGRIAVLSPNNRKLSLLEPPPVNDAESVVALDGTPCIDKWELLLGQDLQHCSVFSTEEKREFLREVLELRFIQTATTTKPYHSGVAVTPHEDMALIEAVSQQFDQDPCMISSHAAIEDHYPEQGLKDVTDKTGYYNDLKGSGRFEKDRLGIVIGCPQPSDDEIQLWGALEGQSITRRCYEDGGKTKGTDLDFGPFGNRILRDSRESEVLQAGMRFGRKESDGERGATVYIHTTTLPNWVQAEKEIPNIHPWEKDDGTIQVVRAIKNHDDWKTGEWSTSEIADAIESLTNRQVLNVLRDELENNGHLNSRRGEGRGNPLVWSNECLEEAGDYGVVDW